jgi:hypothetical protein
METKTYKAVLFHPEGDYVTDFKGEYENQETACSDIWDKIADMGSKWIFYPIPVIVCDTTAVDVISGMEAFEGMDVQSISKHLSQLWQKDADYICDMINAGAFDLIDWNV